MFPRLSLIYRLIAVCLSVTIVMVLFQNHLPYYRANKQPPWGDDVLTAQIRTSRKVSEAHRADTKENDKDNPKADSAEDAALIETQPTEAYTTTIAHVTSTEPPHIVNPHNFKYIINPIDLCDVNHLYILIYVHSAPKNTKKRQMVRDTWGAAAIQKEYNMRVVFVMGNAEDNITTDIVQLESNRYGDIVVEDFHDSYRNLTYKGIAALRWASTYCDNVTFVLKTDDDILVDIVGVMQYMNSSEFQNYGKTNLIVCNQWTRMKVIRDQKSKWYVSKQDYSATYFSPYCSGSAFIMSIDLVKRMYEVSFYTPFFWVDDFYITGLLIKKLNLKHQRLNEAYVLSSKGAIEKATDDKNSKLKFFHISKLTHIYRIWHILRQRANATCGDCFTWNRTKAGKSTS